MQSLIREDGFTFIDCDIFKPKNNEHKVFILV